VGRGHWRYYADESVVFNRLVYLCEFDPGMAPTDGWGMMAEITQRGEDPPLAPHVMLTRVIEDAARVGALPGDCSLIGAHHWIVDPAYVVFTPDAQAIVGEAMDFLRDHDVEPLGRYGRWEYSSMGQVIRDAFLWADSKHGCCARTL
jgi:hypothetical protein